MIPSPSETDYLRGDVEGLRKRCKELEKQIELLEDTVRGKRKMGEWVKTGTCENDDYQCSICNYREVIKRDKCPRCNSLMKI